MSVAGGRSTLSRTPPHRAFALTNTGALGIVFKPCRSAADMFGDVAQLGERCLRTAEVAGSTPVVSTKQSTSRRTRLPVAPRSMYGPLQPAVLRAGE